MQVHFYEIRGCTCSNADGKPVLVAPEYTQLDLLNYYQFILLPDGRWVHFLTNEEYASVMTGYPHRDVVFSHPRKAAQPLPETPEDLAKADRLGWIGIAMIVASVLLGIGLVLLSSAMGDGVPETLELIITGLIGLLQLAGFVMMLFIRIRYPGNRLGKALMWIYIAEVILAIIAVIVMIIACVFFIKSCCESMQDCPG